MSKEGHTTSHVFRGSVRLQVASADGKTEGVAQVLHENESARVENRGNRSGGNRIVMLGPSAKPASFVRRDSQTNRSKIFDLVDVVAGGDGFSGRRGRGIAPDNGRVILDAKPDPKYAWLVGDGKYHRVEGLPFVDGVFIPDGSHGPVQTDSAGHSCDLFEATSNRTSGYVWAGAIPTGGTVTIPTTLGGVDYSAPPHGLLFLHANKGVTFDLGAVRKANPNYKLLRFRAVAGNMETFSEKGEPVSADVWVIVDGQSRFRRREINRFNGAMSVNIAIAEHDRFLTLAATDGGNDIIADWIMFGDPQLEMLRSRMGRNNSPM